MSCDHLEEAADHSVQDVPLGFAAHANAANQKVAKTATPTLEIDKDKQLLIKEVINIDINSNNETALCENSPPPTRRCHPD